MRCGRLVALLFAVSFSKLDGRHTRLYAEQEDGFGHLSEVLLLESQRSSDGESSGPGKPLASGHLSEELLLESQRSSAGESSGPGKPLDSGQVPEEVVRKETGSEEGESSREVKPLSSRQVPEEEMGQRKITGSKEDEKATYGEPYRGIDVAQAGEWRDEVLQDIEESAKTIVEKVQLLREKEVENSENVETEVNAFKDKVLYVDEIEIGTGIEKTEKEGDLKKKEREGGTIGGRGGGGGAGGGGRRVLVDLIEQLGEVSR